MIYGQIIIVFSNIADLAKLQIENERLKIADGRLQIKYERLKIALTSTVEECLSKMNGALPESKEK